MEQRRQYRVQLGIEVPPPAGLLKIGTESTVRAAIIRREHPGDEELQNAGRLKGAQQPALEVVVDIAEILILRRLVRPPPNGSGAQLRPTAPPTVAKAPKVDARAYHEGSHPLPDESLRNDASNETTQVDHRRHFTMRTTALLASSASPRRVNSS